jgi:2-amino-4-hydroxy-6-hydroxymethyldihydropteridine diphosphokinase
MSRAVLSLGSNLGDREAHLRSAVSGLQDVLIVVSGVYETPPWGDPDQPHYLNAAALVAEPDATPHDWLRRAQRLERAAGRERDPARRFGPRTLDVDVIAVWDDDGAPVAVDAPDLTVPHPRAHLRAFVLRPWLDIQPYAQLPGHGWLHELVRADGVAADLAELRARDDVDLEEAPTA